MDDQIMDIVYDKCEFCKDDLSDQERLDCQKKKFVPCCADCMPEAEAKLREAAGLMSGLQIS